MTFRTAYGNAHSENHWRMVNRDECEIPKIPNLLLVDTAPLRKGAPLTILGAWLTWYDRNVEEIGSQVWGWSATNDVGDSNHLSGTAIDVNAPKFPWGDEQAAERVLKEKIAKVREGLRLFEGTVFWGEDWSREDPMHYQMNFPEGDARNEAFAAKLKAGYLGIYKTAPTPEGDDMFTDEDRKKLDYVYGQLQPWPQFGQEREGSAADSRRRRLEVHWRTEHHRRHPRQDRHEAQRLVKCRSLIERS